MKVVWLTGALRSLRAVHKHVSLENPTAAKQVVRLIQFATDRLETFPQSGRVGRIESTYELVVRQLPYIIVYRLKAGEIQILRVFHTAMDWSALNADSKAEPTSGGTDA